MIEQTSKEYRQIWFDENFDLIGRVNAKQKHSVRKKIEIVDTHYLNDWGQSKNKRGFELTLHRVDVNKKGAEPN